MKRRFQDVPTTELTEFMQRNYRLGASFAARRSEGYTGDTWWCEAMDAAKELELRGWVVDGQFKVTGRKA